MRRASILVYGFLLAATLPAALAQESVLMRALRDELARSMDKLQLAESEKPYFISYSVRDSSSVRVTAALGAVISRREGPQRLLSVEVRVGAPDFDNTNFLGEPDFRSALARASFPTPLPLENDYGELRRKIWLATDNSYKQALDHLAKKRAALQNQTRVEEVPDFSEAEPYRSDGEGGAPELDGSLIEELARDVSGVFRDTPHIFVSEVRATSSFESISYVNSEGTSFVRESPLVSIRITAGTQAEDGTPLEDAFTTYARSPRDLPSKSELSELARGLASRLQELRDAEVVDRFNGPVLFEGQAAAELVRRVLVPRLLAVRVPVAGSSRFSRALDDAANPFLDKLGARVLPRFLGVVDDPTLDRFDSNPLMGDYAVDDEGIQTRETTLVERGILKTLLATRNPVPDIPDSTGNRRGSGPAPSNLIVVPRNGLEADELREELLSLVNERELEYGIIVRRIGGSQGRIARSRGSGASRRSRGGTQIDAVVAYKVFPDGREELIRQSALMGISESNFRDIVAASDAATVHTRTHSQPRGFSSFGPLPGFSGSPLISLVVPSLLFEDITVRRSPDNIPHPPVVSHPLASE